MAWQQRLRARWAAFAPREQRALTLAGFALLVALVWSVLLAPALRTVRSVDSQNIKLSAELDRMLALQTRATALQNKPVVAPQDSLKALQSATALLGRSASLQIAGDYATVTLKQVSAQGLAPWFTPVVAAGLSPSDVHLQRSPGVIEAMWSGSIVFRLPAGDRTLP